MEKMKGFLKDKAGVTAIEYGFMAGTLRRFKTRAEAVKEITEYSDKMRKTRRITMNRFLKLSSAFILLLGLSGAAHAFSINNDYIPVGNQYTSPYYATVEDFDGPLAWTWTGSGKVVNGSVSGKYSAPGGVDGINKDVTNYMTVPDPTGGPSGSVRATNLGGVYNYFGLWWGSIDTYNTFTFYKGDDVVLSFTGTQVTAAGTDDGNQLSPGSNHYVNFLGLPDFDSFAMSSTQFAFEADNIAIGYNPTSVPEPTTILLLGLGLIGFAGARRKFKK
jgi:hypothetical protein